MSLSAEDEGLAAEYALGTLDVAERAAVAARRLREPELDAAISAWEHAASAAFGGGAGSGAAADLFARIEARLGGAARSSISPGRCGRALRAGGRAGGRARWRPGSPPRSPLCWRPRPTPPHQFVAVLQKSPDAPAFAMTVDIDKLEFSVRPVAAEAPAGKSYELVDHRAAAAPKSLGVIDAATGERRLTRRISATGARRHLRRHRRAQGGSPDGKPSSAPVFFGKLVPVGP